MSNSTPQGPGPQYGSHADATPITADEERASIAEEIDSLASDDPTGPDPSQEPGPLSDGDPAPAGSDDAVIDISENEGPELTTDVDDVDSGSA